MRFFLLRSVILFGILPHTVDSCGATFCQFAQPVLQAGEAIAFGVSGRTVEMHVQILYQGEADAFGWILPTPFLPDVNVGSDLLFLRLFQRTLPNFRLDIREELSATCNLPPSTCAPAVDSPTAGGGITILKDEAVGPFQVIVLESKDKNPENLRRWIVQNGYDEYESSSDLLNYYVQLDYKFVALRLRKNLAVGEIQPIILRFDLPEGTDALVTPTTCIPIKMTALAAVANMPINTYVLGDYRAVPANFFEVELDESKVNWLGCQTQNCYINDLRSRFASAASMVDQLAVLTEFAGSSSIMANQIQLNVDTAALSASQTPQTFFDILAGANVPSFALMDTIVEKYAPKSETNEDACNALPSLYVPNQIFLMNFCLDRLKLASFDSAGFASELNSKVFEPANDAQNFVDLHPYLTRFYGEMSPENMLKDPFFAFNESLPDVSNIHTATGVPVCDPTETETSAMSISPNGERNDTSIVPARRDCLVWRRTDSIPLFGPNNPPALRYVAREFGGQTGMTIERSADGTFSSSGISNAISTMDARVVNQTVVKYLGGAILTPTKMPAAAPVPNPTSQAATTTAREYTVNSLWSFAIGILAAMVW